MQKYTPISLDVVEKRAITAEADPAIIEFDPPRQGYRYLIKRVSIWARNDVPAPVFVLYVGLPQSAPDEGTAASALVDFTLNGDLDVADERSPIVVPDGQRISAYWYGAIIGEIHAIRIQYDVVQVTTEEDRQPTNADLQRAITTGNAQTQEQIASAIGKLLPVSKDSFPNQ